MDSHQDRYQLLTCTLYDPVRLPTLAWNNDADGSPSPFLLLRLHVDRLQLAADLHDWPEAKAAVSEQSLLAASRQAIQDLAHDASALKIRIVVTQTGQLTATASISPRSFHSFIHPCPNPSFDGPVCEIYIDSQPTSISKFTCTKTTHRPMYDAARARIANSTNSKDNDVLLYNDSNYAMETSICNIAFLRDSKWLTPSLATGCLPGVFRRWLLDAGQIHEDTEGKLEVSTIKAGDYVLLSNSVIGCRLGRIVPHPTH